MPSLRIENIQGNLSARTRRYIALYSMEEKYKGITAGLSESFFEKVARLRRNSGENPFKSVASKIIDD